MKKYIKYKNNLLNMIHIFVFFLIIIKDTKDNNFPF